MSQIKFGTSGWRGVMADDFTFANVNRALLGIAQYVSSEKPRTERHRIIVGRDPRFLGESFVGLAQQVLGAAGIAPLAIAQPAPTPAIAHEVIRLKSDGAINFTASHNPPEYNGIKFSTPDGAPALPEVTKKIEVEIAKLNGLPAKGPKENTQARGESIEVKAPYLTRLKEIVNLNAIKKAKLKVAFDPLWGAARGYSDSLLRDAGIEVTSVHDCRDVLFGGHAPEPDDHLLGDLRQAMKSTGAHIGIATDGDADRFGIVDGDGTFISPNYVLALLFEYLVESRGWKNGVAKSVTTTNLVNALARHYAIQLYETPVGFKYIGELIKEDKIAIGGEESAGLSIRHHVPEKDGVLAGLLCCEMMAARLLAGEPASLGRQLQKLFAKVGSFYPLRENFRLTEEVKAKLTNKLREEPREFAGRQVAEAVRTDGLKLVLEDGSWVCFRLSGTEPVVRIYSEARSESDLQKLSAAAKQWVLQ